MLDKKTYYLLPNDSSDYVEKPEISLSIINQICSLQHIYNPVLKIENLTLEDIRKTRNKIIRTITSALENDSSFVDSSKSHVKGSVDRGVQDIFIELFGSSNPGVENSDDMPHKNIVSRGRIRCQYPTIH